MIDDKYVNHNNINNRKSPALIAVGFDANNNKYIFPARIYDSENSASYQDYLTLIKSKVKNVKLFVTDGKKGVENWIKHHFPGAKYQSCQEHVIRKILKVLGREFNQYISEIRNYLRSESNKNLIDFLTSLGVSKMKLGIIKKWQDLNQSTQFTVLINEINIELQTKLKA